MKKLFQNRLVQRLVWICLLLLIWQGGVWSKRVSPLLLPAPWQVWNALVTQLLDGDLASQIGFSLTIILRGTTIAVALSLAIALLCLYSRVFASLADTLCALAHPLPAIALLPLIIVWFGVGYRAVVAIIVHSTLWPMLLNLIAGLKSTPPVYVECGKSLCSSPLWMLCNVYLPSSLSSFLAGLKIGWARAWRALISAEMIFGAVASSGGVGWFLFQNRVMMDTAGLFAGIFVVAIIGMLVEELLLWVERKTVIRWGMAASK
ncbi:MAG: ABC transporter permease [Oscillospiraceae bacterium]|jgi:NitT/TauT family transport system permease protein